MSGRDERVSPMLLTPSVDTVAFLILAIRKHAQEYRKNGAVVPAGVWDLEAGLSSSVSEGQRGSAPAAVSQPEQVVPMSPRLVTYETAAQLLGMSLSSFKRRVKDGDFHPIDLGGGPRIRVAEIDDRIAAAAAELKGA